MTLLEKALAGFEKIYGMAPTFVARAPGRVNLIGEHTDYNDGFVLPMAIDRAAILALRPRDDDQVIVHSLDFDDRQSFRLSQIERAEEHGWIEYLKGTAWALQQDGLTLSGWEGVLVGDVPIGSGLSSSAALEMATTRAFQAVSGFEWQAAPMALLGQRVENQWLGLKTGIMDQMISASGRADQALLIDCRSLETQLLPLPTETRVVVLDTAVRRGLVDSKYNERRAQCEAAAEFFGVKALRDVTLAQFEAAADQLDPLTQQRARHVISENERTLAAAEVMRADDAVTLGKLMNASHASLRDDFEVSCDELDAMVEIAQAQPGCFGARMTGAGFGGCAMALVAEDAAEAFAAAVAPAYTEATGYTPAIYVCVATDGAALVDIK